MNNLKILRAKTGTSQQELADYIGISRPTYTNKERGKIFFDSKEIKKILEFFKEKGIETSFEEIFEVR